MATTGTRHTSARPWVITGQDISTTAFFWAWAHGAVGAIATAGADIASAVKVAGDITADQAAPRTAAVVVVMPAAAAVIAAADNILTAVGRGPVQAVQSLRMEMVADNLAAAVVVVDRVMAAVAVVERVMAADTTKPGSLTRDS